MSSEDSLHKRRLILDATRDNDYCWLTVVMEEHNEGLKRRFAIELSGLCGPSFINTSNSLLDALEQGTQVAHSHTYSNYTRITMKVQDHKLSIILDVDNPYGEVIQEFDQEEARRIIRSLADAASP